MICTAGTFKGFDVMRHAAAGRANVDRDTGNEQTEATGRPSAEALRKASV
jgi:hypothetical protein